MLKPSSIFRLPGNCASGSDAVTVLLTGVSDDFVLCEVDGATEAIVGARNETGTVFIFQVSGGFFFIRRRCTFKTKVDPAFVTSDPDGDGSFMKRHRTFTASLPFAVDASVSQVPRPLQISPRSRGYMELALTLSPE